MKSGRVKRAICFCFWPRTQNKEVEKINGHQQCSMST